jgi:polar amino acid transport system substrate-binding protein
MKRYIFPLLLCFFASCSKFSSQPLKIGVDSNWYPENFHSKEFYVNGYVEELLLEISKDSGIEIERISANWDSLSSYNFNAAKYDFSRNFLHIGSVLVVLQSAKYKSLQEIEKTIGTLPQDQVLKQNPMALTRIYYSVPELFDALINRDVEAIVVDKISAVGYLSGVYANKLKIAGAPLDDQGLHLVTLKGEKEAVLLFDKSLKHLKKKKKLMKLLNKWQLETNVSS